jgi:hypothetical protein
MLIVTHVVNKFYAFYQFRLLTTFFIRAGLNFILSEMNPVRILKPYLFYKIYNISFSSDVMFLKGIVLSGLTNFFCSFSGLTEFCVHFFQV